MNTLILIRYMVGSTLYGLKSKKPDIYYILSHQTEKQTVATCGTILFEYREMCLQARDEASNGKNSILNHR